MVYKAFRQESKRPASVTTLCEDFEGISVGTWNLLEHAWNNNDYRVSEETITDINLLELKIRQPISVFTKKYSRKEEAINGADWVWIIVGRTGTTFMLYVQAKKLFAKSQRYESLIKKKDPLHQVDALILNKFFYPIGLPVYPIYVFYNFLPDQVGKIGCNCGSMINRRLTGCSYASAWDVKKCITNGEDHFNKLEPYEYALRCLVCGCPAKDGPPTEDIATRFFNRVFTPTERENFLFTLSKTDIDTTGLGLTPQSFLLKEQPDFVKFILNGDSKEYNPFEKLGIDNILILKEE
jgi:hypothetical protein